MSSHVEIYDTTLRDGAQGEGVNFSVGDKCRVAEHLDALGVDFVEGGWPGSNPRDVEFFGRARGLRLSHARLAAFGATRRRGSTCETDPSIQALLLDAGGRVAEGSGENLFVVKGGRLRTNDERSPILLGITRDAVLQLARGLGLEVETGALGAEDLLAADEAFFTGTAVEVTPVREVDGVSIGGGGRGPVTERIQRAFFDATSGRDARYAHWLRRVAAQPVGSY